MEREKQLQKRYGELQDEIIKKQEELKALASSTSNHQVQQNNGPNENDIEEMTSNEIEEN